MIEKLLSQYLEVYDKMKNHRWKELGKGDFGETRAYRDSLIEKAYTELETLSLEELVNTLFLIYKLNRRCEFMGFSVKSGIAIMRLKTKVMDRTLSLFNKTDEQTQNEIRERLKEISIHMP